jgi:hypothetical protein
MLQFQHFFALMFGGGTASLSTVKEKKRKKKGELADILGSSGDAEASLPYGEDEGRRRRRKPAKASTSTSICRAKRSRA